MRTQAIIISCKVKKKGFNEYFLYVLAEWVVLYYYIEFLHWFAYQNQIQIQNQISSSVGKSYLIQSSLNNMNTNCITDLLITK